MTPGTNVTMVRELVRRVQDNPKLGEAIVADPAVARKELENFFPDTGIYRLTVGALGAALLLSVAGALALVWHNSSEVPDILIATTSGALGALAGLLSPR